MAGVKKTLKAIFGQIWELLKGSLPGMLMYACAGAVLVILTMRGEETQLVWSGGNIAWTVVCIVVATVYAGLMAYAHGGNGYDMLVTGNIKRLSGDDSEGGLKISKHKVSKEYRVWKGFAMGGFMMIIPIVAGLIFGANQTVIDEMLYNLMTGSEDSSGAGLGLGVVMVIFMFLSGWTILPIFIPNAAIVVAGGTPISYYLSMLFALIPLVAVGVMYIVGAYAKRAKTLREQLIAEKAAEEEANKEKKINYGALPGTKPKKRK